MSADALKKILAYDVKTIADDYEELSDLIEEVAIEEETNDENLKKAFSIAQITLKNVARKNRENKIELDEFEKEIQRSVIKSTNILILVK